MSSWVRATRYSLVISYRRHSLCGEMVVLLAVHAGSMRQRQERAQEETTEKRLLWLVVLLTVSILFSFYVDLETAFFYPDKRCIETISHQLYIIGFIRILSDCRAFPSWNSKELEIWYVMAWTLWKFMEAILTPVPCVLTLQNRFSLASLPHRLLSCSLSLESSVNVR